MTHVSGLRRTRIADRPGSERAGWDRIIAAAWCSSYRRRESSQRPLLCCSRASRVFQAGHSFLSVLTPVAAVDHRTGVTVSWEGHVLKLMRG